MPLARPLAPALAAFLVAACFSSSDPVGGSGMTGGSGTTGGMCPAGSAGCPCYGNGTCDEGLSCATDADLCVYDDCTPGTLGCACDEGSCSDGSVCMAGFCGMGGGGSTGMASVGGTSVADESGTAVDSSMTGVDTGADTVVMTSGSVSDSVTDTAMSASDTGMTNTCLPCMQTAVETTCAQAYEQCMNSAGCAMILGELQTCIRGGMIADVCVAQTCDAHCPMGQATQLCAMFGNLASCIGNECIQSCPVLTCP